MQICKSPISVSLVNEVLQTGTGDLHLHVRCPWNACSPPPGQSALKPARQQNQAICYSESAQPDMGYFDQVVEDHAQVAAIRAVVSEMVEQIHNLSLTVMLIWTVCQSSEYFNFMIVFRLLGHSDFEGDVTRQPACS